MIHFEWPWLILILPLPLLVRYFMRPVSEVKEAALRMPFLADFLSGEGPELKIINKRWLLWLAVIAWLLLVLATMRPQWLGELVEVPVTGRDLMLAVDLSGSMHERDFVVSGQLVDRLTATKWVAGEFISRRVGDRLGLILFGEQAYLQTPLTFDRETVRTLLNESVIGLAGKATAIGDAIGLAIKRLRERDASNRVLILMTDGNNTAGVVNPFAAAEVAANEGLKIYTIGIGPSEMWIKNSKIIRNVEFEKTLKIIAERTGGRYFRAADIEGFREIYRILDELEPIAGDPLEFRPYTVLYYWPLSLSLLIAGLVVLLRLREL